MDFGEYLNRLDDEIDDKELLISALANRLEAERERLEKLKYDRQALVSEHLPSLLRSEKPRLRMMQLKATL